MTPQKYLQTLAEHNLTDYELEACKNLPLETNAYRVYNPRL